jgi:putative tricarboxylic transport membrane protein
VNFKLGNAGAWGGSVVFAFAAVVFWKSLSLKYFTQYGPGPGMFPRWLSGILILISLIYIWQSLKKGVHFRDILPKGRAMGSILTVLGSLLLFMLILGVTGFTVASTLMLFLIMVREFKWFSALAIALVASVLIFIIFRYVFSIPLPVNIFGW